MIYFSITTPQHDTLNDKRLFTEAQMIYNLAWWRDDLSTQSIGFCRKYRADAFIPPN